MAKFENLELQDILLIIKNRSNISNCRNAKTLYGEYRIYGISNLIQ